MNRRAVAGVETACAATGPASDATDGQNRPARHARMAEDAQMPQPVETAKAAFTVLLAETATTGRPGKAAVKSTGSAGTSETATAGEPADGPGMPDAAVRRLACDRAEAALFFDRYERSLRSCTTNRAAYEETERNYTARAGRRRFRTYGSFRSAYCQFCRRLLRNRGTAALSGHSRPVRRVLRADVNAAYRGC